MAITGTITGGLLTLGLLWIGVSHVYAKHEQPKIAAAKANIGAISMALQQFEISCGRYPTSEEGLNALIHQPENAKNWVGPYLTGFPKDPWGNPYNYQCPGQHNSDFDIWSNGPDGQPGTEDDIGNWSER